MRIRAVLLAAAFALAGGPALAAPDVVASIKPLHALVAAVMGDVGAPGLLVKGAASPHTYALRPSDAAALERADLVFWIGPGMELFLADALGTLAVNARQVELTETPGLVLLPLRRGGAFEPHEHGEAEAAHGHAEEAHGHDAHDHHDETDADMHFWLDPDNAGLMVTAIAEALVAADPENAETYMHNAGAELDRLTALAAEIAAMLEPVRDVPFVVFHDAYQYFESRFGLAAVGALTVTPDTMPGAARIGQLRDTIRESGAACVFAEPQFSPAIIGSVIEGTSARTGTLDPEGATLAEGAGLYAALLTGLAQSFRACLGH